MKTVQQLINKYYPSEKHPHRIFERRIMKYISKESILLDAGCGCNASVISQFIGKAKKVIGVDKTNFSDEVKKLESEFIKCDLKNIPLESESIDLVISRSVLEHIKYVDAIYKEINRILKTNGHFIFLVPNLWDYVSIISFIVPNSLHKKILSQINPGRNKKDIFDVYYKSNTIRSIRNLARKTGFKIISVEYLTNVPDMLMFNPLLFRVGIIYDMVISKIKPLKFLKGWILADLKKIN